MKLKCKIVILMMTFGLVFSPAALLAEKITTSHGVALFGDLMYGPDFKHFDYVNPNAPKGGLIVQDIPAFDSIHQYITLGTTTGFTILPEAQTLFTLSADEPNSAYGLIAETLTYPDDYSWVEFKIREIPYWNDGTKLGVHDILFSFDVMQNKADPTRRELVSNISSCEQTGPYTVRFTYNESAPDISNIYKLATQFPVFPSHYYKDRDFSQPSTEIYPQSTPYVFMKVDVGNTIILKRDPNYWGRNLPVEVGMNNIDIIRMDVYRDQGITYEAFMSGNLDMRIELVPARWKTAYDTDAVQKGFIKKRADVINGSVMFLGFGMNIRRPQFSDVKTREAVTNAFDWEWTNENIFHGMYGRLDSYFTATELAHEGAPQGEELALLEKYRGKVDPRVFTTEFTPPNTGGTQAGLRKNLRRATMLLREAGWVAKDGVLHRDGQPFVVDFLIADMSQEAMLSPFIENLKLLGIDAALGLVDATAFWPRVFDRDWDMLSNGLFPHSLSPGTEFRTYWGSEAADQARTFNSSGIKDEVIDELIEEVINAPNREKKLIACRALDRVLLYGYYSIPLYYWNKALMAHWDRFGMPETPPKWAASPPQNTWWVDPAKDAAVAKYRGSM